MRLGAIPAWPQASSLCRFERRHWALGGAARAAETGRGRQSPQGKLARETLAKVFCLVRDCMLFAQYLPEAKLPVSGGHSGAKRYMRLTRSKSDARHKEYPTARSYKLRI